MSLTIIILTLNEARHIKRAIASVSGLADKILVVDSGSTDGTVELAKQLGAETLENTFVNQAQQFNWALTQLPSDTDWIMRVDADEILDDELVSNIANRLDRLPVDVSGVYVSRRIHFMRRPIRWGGVFPVSVLRIFRFGKGRSEERWMDEHIIVDGNTVSFFGEIIDDNLNSLTWWTEKHNAYASREVIDLLSREYGFMAHETVADIRSGQQVDVKRWLKERVYVRLPGGLRAFAYFIYRYVVRLGFMDGKEGTAFHVLQGFWYRYLVDMKLHETKTYMRKHSVSVEVAIRDVLGLEINPKSPNA